MPINRTLSKAMERNPSTDKQPYRSETQIESKVGGQPYRSETQTESKVGGQLDGRTHERMDGGKGRQTDGLKDKPVNWPELVVNLRLLALSAVASSRTPTCLDVSRKMDYFRSVE